MRGTVRLTKCMELATTCYLSKYPCHACGFKVKVKNKKRVKK